jgi:prepilin-type N-terminal cleavage/methylation domain-containing protein
MRLTVTPTNGRKSRLPAPRRGVTLVEMLVTVAVLVIIMTVLVQIFQSATGALSAAQTFQELDNQLKLLESTIRSDLGGVTAHFTPPLDPAQNLGYFEYGENEFADIQGEDSDDYLRFTAKAPPGQPFTGRIWVTQPAGAALFYNAAVQPVTVTSEYAEIIYFLRNGNLYRRVLLIAPELQPAIVPTVGNLAFLPSNAGTGVNFQPTGLGGVSVSWQGVNDLSAHPATTGPNSATVTPSVLAAQTIVLNTLSSLTNRENRFASPRFADDYYNLITATFVPDGFSDDVNGDKVPDLYPTLYPNVLATGLINAPNYLNYYSINTGPFQITSGLLAFPYIFPGAYTIPQILSADQYGWIHSPSPYANVIQADGNGQGMMFESNPLGYLQSLNHNPLDLADNVPTPSTPPITHGSISGPQTWQTWWGFPTWRETLSVNWNDPTKQVNDASGIGVNPASYGQPNGLSPRLASVVPVAEDNQLLPWMGVPLTTAQGGSFPNGYDFSIIRRNPQVFSDAPGYHNNMSIFLGVPGGPIDPVWAVSFEDDLVMTNVRSFDVKAYDNSFGGYADLGWADDLRLWLPYSNEAGFINPNNIAPGLASTPPLTVWPPLAVGGVAYDTVGQTFAHEGRMPPITNDLRFDAQFGIAANYLGAGSGYLTANMGTYNNGNIGDDSPGVVRLRRVWDSWSTTYSNAPGHGLNAGTGFLVGPPYSPPVYPSYPAPYPAALRGIQIQIRVADPTNQRVKSLTIRQDFAGQL